MNAVILGPVRCGDHRRRRRALWLMRAASPNTKVPIEPDRLHLILGEGRDLQFLTGIDEKELQERLLAPRSIWSTPYCWP